MYNVLGSLVTGDDALLNANIAEALLFANMGDNAFDAKIAVALLVANMGDNALNAKSASSSR